MPFPLLQTVRTLLSQRSSSSRWSSGSSTVALPIRFLGGHCPSSTRRWPKGCCTFGHTRAVWGCTRTRSHRGWSWGSKGPCTTASPLRTGGGCWRRMNYRSRSASSTLFGCPLISITLFSLRSSAWWECSMSSGPSARCYFRRVAIRLWRRLRWFFVFRFGCFWGMCRIIDNVYDTFFNCCTVSSSANKGCFLRSLHISHIKSMYPSYWWSSSRVSPNALCLDWRRILT